MLRSSFYKFHLLHSYLVFLIPQGFSALAEYCLNLSLKPSQFTDNWSCLYFFSFHITGIGWFWLNLCHSPNLEATSSQNSCRYHLPYIEMKALGKTFQIAVISNLLISLFSKLFLCFMRMRMFLPSSTCSVTWQSKPDFS